MVKEATKLGLGLFDADGLERDSDTFCGVSSCDLSLGAERRGILLLRKLLLFFARAKMLNASLK